MRARNGISLLKEAASDFSKDDAMTQAAALAFYTALSLAPLLLILVWLAGLLGPTTEQRLVDELVSLIGPEGGEAIKLVIEGAQEKPHLRGIAGLAGFGTLLFSASGVFGQLQHAMNTIWNIEAKPHQGIRGFLRKRLLSIGMVIAIGFLLMVSMAASAALSAAVNFMQGSLPGTGALWRLVDIALSIGMFTLGFAAIYKVLPDASIAWKDTWVGGLITAALFTGGKILIGLYLGNSSVGSAYGAAGSLIVLLVWVYYSSVILFFGAEITERWASMRGRRIQPDRHAAWKGSGDTAYSRP
jgi:membrane protein